MFIAGADGCSAGWVTFKVELPSLATSVERMDLTSWLRKRPSDVVVLTIDIPIGLFDRPRGCDIAARKLLGSPRRNSVFPAPCRGALLAVDHATASACNRQTTGKGLSIQAWCIAPKIRQIDDVMTAQCQQWAFEVHPEVSFWALPGGRPMVYGKKTKAGSQERLELLQRVFPDMQHHCNARPPGVRSDDLLDAAAAAWTALRIHNAQARQVCEPELDARGLSATIWY